MKSIITAIAFALSLFGLQAQAQTAPIQGIQLILSTNLTNSSWEYRWPGLEASTSNSDISGSIEAQYTMPLSENFQLLAGGSFGVGNVSAGILKANGINFSTKIKSQLSAYVAPAFRLTPNNLVYVKLAANRATVESTDSVTSVTNGVRLNGSGIGIGVQSYFTQNVLVQGEYMQNSYRSFNNNKIDTGVLSIGIGYKF